MIIAVSADLLRFDQLAFVKRIFALGTFYKNALGADGAAAAVALAALYLWFIPSEPSHICESIPGLLNAASFSVVKL